MLRACNMAFTFARHVEAQEIWLPTVVRYETTFSRTPMWLIYDFGEARTMGGGNAVRIFPHFPRFFGIFQASPLL